MLAVVETSWLPLLADIGWPAWIGLGLVVFVGTVLQVGAGLGFGSVAAPGAMLLAPQLMPGSILCLSFASASLGASKMGGRIVVREVVIALIGRTIGAAVAAWMVASIASKDLFALVFAAITLLGVAMSATGLKLQPTPVTLLVAGALSGLMATVTTIGGPPIALVYRHQPAEQARATMNAYFALGQIPPLAALWIAGLLDLSTLIYAAALLPAVAAGVAAARFAKGFIDRRYTSILLGFCIVAAIVIGGRAIYRLIG